MQPMALPPVYNRRPPPYAKGGWPHPLPAAFHSTPSCVCAAGRCGVPSTASRPVGTCGEWTSSGLTLPDALHRTDRNDRPHGGARPRGSRPERHGRLLAPDATPPSFVAGGRGRPLTGSGRPCQDPGGIRSCRLPAGGQGAAIRRPAGLVRPFLVRRRTSELGIAPVLTTRHSPWSRTRYISRRARQYGAATARSGSRCAWRPAAHVTRRRHALRAWGVRRRGRTRGRRGAWQPDAEEGHARGALEATWDEDERPRLRGEANRWTADAARAQLRWVRDGRWWPYHQVDGEWTPSGPPARDPAAALATAADGPAADG